MKIGITGTIASGKTSVSILLKKRGFPVFNADQYAKMSLHNGNECFDKLVDLLGEDIIGEDGDIDAKKMAQKIFTNEEYRLQVNSIVHPFVKKGMLRFMERNNGIVFCEVPLLYEAKWEDCFDSILVVTCDRQVAIERLMRDRDYSEEEANARYDSQIASLKQVELADYVIHNDGDLKELNTLVNKFVREIRERSRYGHRS